MTREEAQAEAVRRWGRGWARESSYVFRSRGPFRHPFLLPFPNAGKFMVGKFGNIPGEATTLLLGDGDSWEAAFADADRRQQEGGS